MIWASQLALADAHQASMRPAPDWEVMPDMMQVALLGVPQGRRCGLRPALHRSGVAGLLPPDRQLTDGAAHLQAHLVGEAKVQATMDARHRHLAHEVLDARPLARGALGRRAAC